MVTIVRSEAPNFFTRLKRRACSKCTSSFAIRLVFVILLVVCGFWLLMKNAEISTRIFADRSKYERPNAAALLSHVKVSPQAAALPAKGEILCWVLTSDKYHDTRARVVNQTWLTRCDHGVFFTNAPFKDDQRMPYRTVFAGIPDQYALLFHKTRYAFYYISEVMKADFDWFVKADDDTYLIMENLRAYLHTLDPTKPHFLGHRMKPYLQHGYNSGGGGYILSRKALELYIKHAHNNATICPDDSFEDVGIGKCLANLGIFPHKTANEKGQQRFNAYHPQKTIDGWENSENWVFDPIKTGLDGVARDVISFHHLSVLDMQMFEILLYRVNVGVFD